MSSRAKLLSAQSIMFALAFAGPARALEPLGAFFESAKAKSFDAREARATLEQREAEVDQSWLHLAPVVGATATYTRNQYEAIVTFPTGDPANPTKTATITPQDQGDLFLNATIPLVDVGAWERVGAAKRAAEAAQSRVVATDADVKKVVARDYYQLVAARAVRQAAESSLDAANKNLAYVSSRKDAGFASELDYKRALAEVQRNEQTLADAGYQSAVAARALATASGKEPGEGSVALSLDLAAEAPLAEWEGTNVDALPQVRAQAEDARAQDRQASATRMGLLPTLSATAQERVTNATGFSTSPYYTLAVSAKWTFDASTLSATAAASHAATTAHIREERVRQQAIDDIHTAWLEVTRDIEKARAARAQEDASDFASQIARERYEAGTANFLDVTTAERDAFSAKVSLIQANADLAYARVALRLAAGRKVATP